MAVQEVDIEVVIPSDRVGIVIMHAKADLSTTEPFKWNVMNTERQLQRIQRTLDIACEPGSTSLRTYFTIFPEYSVPTDGGVDLIQQNIEAERWPNNSIVVAGLDGLTFEQFENRFRGSAIVANGSETHNIARASWINCCVIWIKDRHGSVQKYVQPKQVRAWPEEALQYQEMHCGSSTFVFRAKFDNNLACNFLSLICFDWIGKGSADSYLSKSVLSDIASKHPGEDFQLHWLFVLQENRKPNHHAFLEHTRDFFLERNHVPSVVRDYCVVLLANNAGAENPGECTSHGNTALVFSQIAAFKFQGKCPQTYSGNPNKIRNSPVLDGCHDILFRECGSCVHSIAVHPPRFFEPSASNKTSPVDRPQVHSLTPEIHDPRVPGVPVPGVVKWLNDKVDVIQPTEQRIKPTLIAASSNLKFSEITRSVRRQDGRCLQTKMIYASSNIKDESPDLWGSSESDALGTLLDTLTIFGVAHSIDVSPPDVHANVSIDGEELALISVRGNSHEECFRHLQRKYTPPARQVTLIVSRDLENTSITERERKVTEVVDDSAEKPFTNPAASIKRTDFSALAHLFKTVADEETLRTRINALLE